MVTKETIDEFLKFKTFAIIGVSRDPKKFGSIIYKELLSKGYNVFPVNPNAETIDGNKCFRDISQLPSEVENIVVVASKKNTEYIVDDAIKKGIKNIWINNGSESPESIEVCEFHDINFIHNECILMHCQPVNGVHAFHRFVNKVFGKLPK